MGDQPHSTQQPPASHTLPGYYTPPYPAQEGDEIDLFELWQQLVKEKRLIFAIAAAATFLALVVSLVMTPMYRAGVLIAPAGEGGAGGGLGALAGQFGGLASMAGISLSGGGSEVDTAVATLKSRKFIGAFIADLDLKPLLFRDAWDAEAQGWKEPPAWSTALWKVKAALLPAPQAADSGEQLAPGEPSAWDAFKLFSKEILSVSQDKKTGLVTVTLEWEDPNLTADWANALVERVNADLRGRAVKEAERSIAYLQEQLSLAELNELRIAIAKIIEGQVKSITFAKVSEEYAFKIIDPAVTPEEKSKPKRGLIVVLGFVLGLVLGVVAVFVKGFANNPNNVQSTSRKTHQITES